MRVTLELPALPVAHARVLSLISDPVPNLHEVVMAVEGDPGLTAAVLRAANSAASSPISRIGTANDAVIRIGLSATRRILTGVVLGTAFDGLGRSGIDVDELWRHLLSTALIADGATGDPRARSTAFTAGILHDLGRLAMATSTPDAYRRVLDFVSRGIEVGEAERHVFGADHAGFGAEIAEAWGFPTEIVEAIAHHHRGSDGLAAVTLQARRVSWELGTGDGVVRPDAPEIDDPDGHSLIAAVGGIDELRRRLEWYRGAILAR